MSESGLIAVGLVGYPGQWESRMPGPTTRSVDGGNVDGSPTWSKWACDQMIAWISALRTPRDDVSESRMSEMLRGFWIIVCF